MSEPQLYSAETRDCQVSDSSVEFGMSGMENGESRFLDLSPGRLKIRERVRCRRSITVHRTRRIVPPVRTTFTSETGSPRMFPPLALFPFAPRNSVRAFPCDEEKFRTMGRPGNFFAALRLKPLFKELGRSNISQKNRNCFYCLK